MTGTVVAGFVPCASTNCSACAEVLRLRKAVESLADGWQQAHDAIPDDGHSGRRVARFRLRSCIVSVRAALEGKP